MRVSHVPDILGHNLGKARGRFLLSLWKTLEKTDRSLGAPRQREQRCVGDGEVTAGALNGSDIPKGTLTTKGDHSWKGTGPLGRMHLKLLTN